MLGETVVTGLVVLSAIGQGRAAFAEALFAGRSAFGIMQRPGRQRESTYFGAEIPEILFPFGTERQTSLSLRPIPSRDEGVG